MTPSALIDSNVLVATVAEQHQHHLPSRQLMQTGRFAVAAHSYAEAFNTLTRRNGPFITPPQQAWHALRSATERTRLIGLTPTQTLDAVGRYAAAGNIGARVYDWLIGETARMNGIAALVTWNVADFRPLFPQLRVETPETWR